MIDGDFDNFNQRISFGCPFFLKENSVEQCMCWFFQCCVYRSSVWDYSAGKSE